MVWAGDGKNEGSAGRWNESKTWPQGACGGESGLGDDEQQAGLVMGFSGAK